MNTWQLQEAKAKLSDLVQKALSQGPQEITLRGEPAVVVISKSEFDQLSGKKDTPSFVQFMQQSPLAGSKLTIKRDRSTARDVDLE